jgi:hypothetical protein
MSRQQARELGIDIESRPWAPAIFFGFSLDPDIWRRQPPSEPLPLGTYAEPDWGKTLPSWKQLGWTFQWDRDTHTTHTGFIHTTHLNNASGRLLDLNHHKPLPPEPW